MKHGQATLPGVCGAAFLALAEAVGKMTEMNLSQLKTLLEILFTAETKNEGTP